MGCQGSVIVFRVTLVTRVRAPAMPIRQLAADVRAHEQERFSYGSLLLMYIHVWTTHHVHRKSQVGSLLLHLYIEPEFEV